MIRLNCAQGEFLARHIAKFEEIVRDLSLPTPEPGTPAKQMPASARPVASY